MKVRTLMGALALLAIGTATYSCDDGKTYAELLNDEKKIVNNFLADQRVENSIPADTVFETGPEAPYYRLDEDGNLYMQVIDAGTPGNRVKDNELLYFRFTRYRLDTSNDGDFTYAEGNDDVSMGNYSFRYNNFELSSSYNFGTGIQAPLRYLPVDCQVNLIIKSSEGLPAEMSNVTPWLFRLRYFRPKS